MGPETLNSFTALAFIFPPNAAQQSTSNRKKPNLLRNLRPLTYSAGDVCSTVAGRNCIRRLLFSETTTTDLSAFRILYFEVKGKAGGFGECTKLSCQRRIRLSSRVRPERHSISRQATHCWSLCEMEPNTASETQEILEISEGYWQKCVSTSLSPQ